MCSKKNLLNQYNCIYHCFPNPTCNEILSRRHAASSYSILPRIDTFRHSLLSHQKIFPNGISFACFRMQTYYTTKQIVTISMHIHTIHSLYIYLNGMLSSLWQLMQCVLYVIASFFLPLLYLILLFQSLML